MESQECYQDRESTSDMPEQPVSIWAQNIGIFSKLGAQCLEPYLPRHIIQAISINSSSFLFLQGAESECERRLPSPVEHIIFHLFVSIVEETSPSYSHLCNQKLWASPRWCICLISLLNLNFHKGQVTCKLFSQAWTLERAWLLLEGVKGEIQGRDYKQYLNTFSFHVY